MSRTMGRLAILILACTIMFLTFHLSEGTSVGLNWGRMSKMKLLPSMVVEMLFANGVQKVKLHSFNPGIVQAFSGSNLEIMMTIPNPEVGLVSTPYWAKDYVRRNVTRAYKRIDLNVKYLMIGNEPYTMVDNYTSKYATTFDAALQHVTKYLKEQPKPYSDIKASIPHAPDVLIPYITKPSEADFNDGVKERMLRILQTLDSSAAPFVVNIYPHLSLIEKGYPFEFAFFDNDSGFSIKDGDKLYTNVFDFVYDSFVCALRKHGYKDMEIIVSQVGWPTDGHFYANISTAQRFYDGFIKKMAMDEGTPLRPGPMQVYLYNLHDENIKEITYRGPSMRHYGIYDYKGQPKLQMDLSMRGLKNVTLEPAHGIMSMPKRWCVYNDKKLKSNQTAQVLMEQFEYACSQSDCSKLFFGSSYNNLTFEGNISYAFNSYFQGRNQIEEECDFKGLGVIQLEDPSQKYGCPFPLQFISTVFTWGQGEVMVTLPAIGANAALGLVQNGVERLGKVSESFMMMIIIMPLLSLVFLVVRL